MIQSTAAALEPPPPYPPPLLLHSYLPRGTCGGMVESYGSHYGLGKRGVEGRLGSLSFNTGTIKKRNYRNRKKGDNFPGVWGEYYAMVRKEASVVEI